MESEVHQYYGNKLRVRVCGLCIVGDRILLLNHSGITPTNFWSPPGGGINFGESAEDCLKREFGEEVGLEIQVKDFLFACELIKRPLHAIELFFHVSPATNQLKTGQDPEPGSPSIIKQARFVSWEEIASMPATEVHGIFRYADHPSNVDKIRGFFKL